MHDAGCTHPPSLMLRFEKLLVKVGPYKVPSVPVLLKEAAMNFFLDIIFHDLLFFLNR